MNNNYPNQRDQILTLFNLEKINRKELNVTYIEDNNRR